MSTKDYFSDQSKIYATFRPTYPEDLYQFIFQHLKKRSTAWDCATGNGQVAQYLSKHFDQVYATDISQKQIDNAFTADNIRYSVSKAEQTTFPDAQFDLITVAQALHWINVDEFYNEARRTANPGALLAVWGYSLLTIDEEIDPLFLDFYHNIVGPYWDSARRLVEQQYAGIPFPFEQITTPVFNLTVQWDLRQFTGYLSSWSATQKYIQVKGHDPVAPFTKTLQKYWKAETVKTASFPLFMKLGKING
jgi:hypothetical protein